MTVRVELFGIARARAGVSDAELRAGSLGELLRRLVELHPGLDGEVILDGAPADGWLVSLDGERFIEDPETPLPDGATVLLLSAHAGG